MTNNVINRGPYAVFVKCVVFTKILKLIQLNVTRSNKSRLEKITGAYLSITVSLY